MPAQCNRKIIRECPRNGVSAGTAPGGTAKQDTRYMVLCVAVASGGPFDLLDGGVVRFDLGCGAARDDEDFGLLGPAAVGAPEPVRLGLGGPFDQGL